MFFFLFIHVFVEFKLLKAGILCVLFLAVSPVLFKCLEKKKKKQCLEKKKKQCLARGFPGAHWQRIHLPVRGHGFSPWSRKIPCAEQLSHVPQVLSPHVATTEAHAPTACALKQEKPLQ